MFHTQIHCGRIVANIELLYASTQRLLNRESATNDSDQHMYVEHGFPARWD